MRYASLALGMTLVAASAASVYAAPCNPTTDPSCIRDWEVTNSNSHSTAAVNINAWTFYNVGSTIYGKSAATGSASNAPTALGSYTTGASIDSFPQAVQLTDGKWYTFVASQDGYLYKLDVAGTTNGGTPMGLAVNSAHTQKVSLRRSSDSGCLVKDSLTATPTIQLNAFAGGTPYTLGKDIVIVPTHHGCGSATTNMVYAFDASDITLTPIWIFNQYGDYSMDYASEGCSLDYTRSRVYCGTNLTAGRYQNTVWALDTNTGALNWATNLNSVHARPQLGRSTPEHLYVTDMLGVVHAMDPATAAATGTEDWQVVLSALPGAYTSQNLWAEWRSGYAQTIYLTDSSGILYSIYDGGKSAGAGEELWTAQIGGSVKIKSLGSVSPTLGKLYVGADNGGVYQLNLSTGSTEGYHVVTGTALGAAGSSTVTDPTLYVASGAQDINKMVATAWGASGTTRQFSVPFATSTGYASLACPNPGMQNGNECKSWDAGTCGNGWCSTDGFCYTKPKPNGTVCDDGSACTGTGPGANKDSCQSGVCRGAWFCAADSQNCASDSRACGAGKVCYFTPGSVAAGFWSCIDVLNGSASPSAPCGSMTRTCGNTTGIAGASVWNGQRTCVKGVCQRANDFCTPPTPTQLETYRDTYGSPNGSYASGLTFGRYATSATAGTCPGFESTYQAGFGLATTAFSTGTTCSASVVCGAANDPLAVPAGAQGDSDAFTDPLPSTSIAPTKITVTIRGLTCGAATDTATVSLVNATSGVATVIGTGTLGTQVCVCTGCGSPILNVTATSATGFAAYNSGGQMKIRVKSNTGAWYVLDADVKVEVPVTVPFNGTICSVCGVTPSKAMLIGSGTSGDSNTFSDPLAGTTKATRIGVKIRGISCGNSNDTADVYLVNSTTGLSTYLGSGSMGTQVCSCVAGSCVSPLLNVSFWDAGGINNYNYSGNMAIRVTAKAGNWYPADVEVSVAGATENFVRKVLTTDTSGSTQSFVTDIATGRQQVGYMHGVAPILNGAFTAVGDVFTNFVNRTDVSINAGLGWLLNFNTSVYDITTLFTSGPVAAPTRCPSGGTCAYAIDDFNYGPTAPVWDGLAGGTGERFFIGNYTRNGDLYKITKTGSINLSSFSLPTMTAAVGWTGTDPPWCSTAGCTADVDRITALAYPVPVVYAGTSLSDKLVRIAHGTKLEFYNIDYTTGTIAVVAAPFIEYTLDFKTTTHPGDRKTTPGSSAVGSGGVPWLPVGSIATIVSITADPLNGTNDTYVELRDTNGKNFLAHVRGDDFSVRPLASYKDVLGTTHPGVLAEMGITATTAPYNAAPWTFPATTYARDGRLTSSSQVALHRLVPVSPTAARTNSTATVLQLPLVP